MPVQVFRPPAEAVDPVNPARFALKAPAGRADRVPRCAAENGQILWRFCEVQKGGYDPPEYLRHAVGAIRLGRCWEPDCAVTRRLFAEPRFLLSRSRF